MFLDPFQTLPGSRSTLRVQADQWEGTTARTTNGALVQLPNEVQRRRNRVEHQRLQHGHDPPATIPMPIMTVPVPMLQMAPTYQPQSLPQTRAQPQYPHLPASSPPLNLSYAPEPVNRWPALTSGTEPSWQPSNHASGSATYALPPPSVHESSTSSSYHAPEPLSPPPTHYQALGLDPDATRLQVVEAYTKFVSRKDGRCNSAGRDFKQLQSERLRARIRDENMSPEYRASSSRQLGTLTVAYEVLSDSNSRARYDQEIGVIRNALPDADSSIMEGKAWLPDKNPYELLGIASNSNLDAIKLAYRAHHQAYDEAKDDMDDRHRKMARRKLNERRKAYKYLKKPQNRAKYEKYLLYGSDASDLDGNDEDEDIDLCDDVSTIDLGKSVASQDSESSRQSSSSRAQSSGSSNVMSRPAAQLLQSPSSPWIDLSTQSPPAYSVSEIGSRNYNFPPVLQNYPGQIVLDDQGVSLPPAGFHWPYLPQSQQRRASVADPSDHAHSAARGRTKESRSTSDGNRNQKKAASLHGRSGGTSKRGQGYESSSYSQQGSSKSFREDHQSDRKGDARTSLRRSRSSTVNDASATASRRKGKEAITHQANPPSDSSTTSVDRSFRDKGKGKGKATR